MKKGLTLDCTLSIIPSMATVKIKNILKLNLLKVARMEYSDRVLVEYFSMSEAFKIFYKMIYVRILDIVKPACIKRYDCANSVINSNINDWIAIEHIEYLFSDDE